MKTRKTQATTSSLNRWCLRALHQSCDSMLYNAIHSSSGAEPLAYARHQGPPPLRFCCIAPHCQEWKCVDDYTGYCCYRKNIPNPAALPRGRDIIPTQHVVAPLSATEPSTRPA